MSFITTNLCESMREYIQRWSIIKNSAEHVSDERAIDAFVGGIRRQDLVEEITDEVTQTEMNNISLFMLEEEIRRENNDDFMPKFSVQRVGLDTYSKLVSFILRSLVL